MTRFCWKVKMLRLSLSVLVTARKTVDVAQAATCVRSAQLLSGVQVKDKAPTYVGGRMGRPEKAKRREMKPLVHVLFPVSLAGGTHSDLLEAAKQGHVFVEMVKRKCPNCKTYTLKVKCPNLRLRNRSREKLPSLRKSIKGKYLPNMQNRRRPVPAATS